MRLLSLRFLVALLSCVFCATSISAKQLVIYHDADYTGHASSAESMAMGFNTALATVNHKVQGYELKLIAKDHRGNVKRSKKHMEQFLKDEQVLLALGGLHSPPYLANRTFINQNEILLMIPWAAAGPITRYADAPNWIYRVSVDDTKAGKRLAQFAITKKQCKNTHLLLENTGWGKSNQKTLTKSFEMDGIPVNGIKWFEWNTKSQAAKLLLHDIINKRADCIIFVGNAIEGEVFAKAMTELPAENRLPIISHWGITGGAFHQTYKEALHGKLNLSFLQTCFSFNSSNLDAYAKNVLARAYDLYSDKLNRPEDIQAPPGFIHAYDIGLILIEALNQIELSGHVQQDRKALRQTLENLNSPVKGLVKTYTRPFSPWSANNTDAHEALGLNDLCMASFDQDGIIRLK